MTGNDNPFQALERIFHEPNRLAIMAALCAASEGMTFSELKTGCRLTDGNLNRHLKVLKESKVIRIQKEFVDDKPRTTVFISARGLDRFHDYLEALNDVMKQTRAALPSKTASSSGSAREKRAAT